MRGKRVFCPGEKCKNAWKYANRIGKIERQKLNTSENIAEQIKNIPDSIGEYPTIVGQLTRVTTTADQCVRIQIDVPLERVKVDTIQYLNRSVVLAFIEDNGKEEKSERSGDKEEEADGMFD